MSRSADYLLCEDVPDAAEYRELRRRAGLAPKSAEAAALGLPNTLLAATVRDRGALVAMGRVVGDGGCNFQIVDMAVHPDYQRQGLGTRIMQSLMTRLLAIAPASAYISLVADDHSPALYRKFGFEPVTPHSIGMARRL